MPYTVKEVSALSGVTVKTLHHYHKIGLLLPCEISEAGYRLYGMKELERLQQILFYRELDLPLVQIKLLLEGEPDRAAILKEQKALLHERKHRLETMIQTGPDQVFPKRRVPPEYAGDPANRAGVLFARRGGSFCFAAVMQM
ncbi:MerR family transcriptional regulator [Paenibacillus macerans]|uniref:MerR family transcriptional regulator n=1 Tax=Paenibacillus macerans TaxID=44252 RepID=UPI0037CCA1B9